MALEGRIMSWRMIGKPYATADLTAVPTITQRFQHATLGRASLLRGINVGVIFYNDPTFTSITLELWSDRSNGAGALIAQSSTSHTKLACMEGENSAYKVLGFTFPDAPLKPGSFYRIALKPVGYTGDATAHIAWRLSYPDPQYRSGLTLNAAKGANHPFEFSIISAAV